MRYRFNLVKDTGILLDEEGTELPDIGTASFRAIRTARDIMAAELKGGRVPLNWSIEIVDETGEPQAVVFFADTVTLH